MKYFWLLLPLIIGCTDRTTYKHTKEKFETEAGIKPLSCDRVRTGCESVGQDVICSGVIGTQPVTYVCDDDDCGWYRDD